MQPFLSYDNSKVLHSVFYVIYLRAVHGYTQNLLYSRRRL